MDKISTDEAKIAEILTRSIDSIYPTRQAFESALKSGERLSFYVGIDPTADYVHLGHSTNYLLLKRLHNLGHKINVLVGDFTAMIGDPSDKTSARVQLTRQQVQENLKTFKEQIGKILPFDDATNPIEFKFNSDWLSPLTFRDAVELASHFTVQQMIERDAFQKRLQKNKPLYVHEFFYPLMQGYDSVAMNIDGEIGGTDQTFNMLAGRTLVRKYNGREKFVITTTLLTNPETGEKLMSKSLGTGIALNLPANIMFRKIMQLPDCSIEQVMTDCTEMPLDEIQQDLQKIQSGENPKNIKLKMAYVITKMYHGESSAQKAKEEWIRLISEKDISSNDYEKITLSGQDDMIDLFADEMHISKNSLRRLFIQSAVRLNGEKIALENFKDLKKGDKITIGKKNRFIIT
jgi:tyrosyl-tRNA synthetase